MTLAELPDYAQLRDDIAEALTHGRDEARKAVESVRLQTYREVGSRLTTYLDSSDRQYGDQTLKQLATDVGIDLRLLYEIVEFRRRIEIVAPGPQLTWSHYRRIIRIGDSEARTRYLEAAIANGWSVRQLEAQIADGALSDPVLELPAQLEDPSDATLIAKRGEPWVYLLAEKPGIGRVLDLGFRVYEQLSSDTDPGFPKETLVQSAKEPSGSYDITIYEKRRHVHSYKATVASIIDADTLWVTIDCGFRTLCDQKVRLRGIDSPERKTPAGVRARDFVARALDEVDQIVVSTTKLDLYDRYLSDILYLPGEDDPARIAQNGRYLNRELVDGGFARRWTETPTVW